MGRKRIAAEMFIFMNGQKVGRLLQNAAGKLEMTYAEEWLGAEARRPLSLSLPLSSQKHSGLVVENFFDNLLPDSQPIRNRIQARFGARTNRSFDLLWHIGRECVGALQLFPEDAAMDVRRVDGEPLTEARIAETLRNYRTMPLGMGTDTEFRISMAGAQEKTALLHLDGGWHRPQGATPTTHIFKLPIGRIEHSNMDLSDSVENEWLCHLILKAYGIPVAGAEMATFDGVKALVVERFDRRWAEDRSWIIRLPQEDMCQALGVPPALKYESDGGPGIGRIMELLFGSSEGLADRRTFMTLQVIFWLLGAIDGHAKNFSIFLLPGGAFRLTPAYDILSAYPLVAKRQLEQPNLRMAMAVNGRNRHYAWARILHRHWLGTAQACRLPAEEMETIVGDLLDRMDEVIQTVTEQLPPSFPADTAGPILDGMREARDRLIRSQPQKD
ncbi:MAG: type II toxin-antitoxin system HipA family toxin [Desulfuromonadales bacterium]|uniref:type II toxin-antitoxin system HipA family toxin n=1 Tax=Desulfuromonas sp. KJ2020 TaxID=2919173 RepID=UPI0020A755A2|nr:type II toxin-antitoxin system HipA family toxin [Desulfuromonas sp. KJ2020]MCP3175883.1 type II toxin-antitoxin system HipA family toxin [Desulfuromonas sp. KJ2020]